MLVRRRGSSDHVTCSLESSRTPFIMRKCVVRSSEALSSCSCPAKLVGLYPSQGFPNYLSVIEKLARLREASRRCVAGNGRRTVVGLIVQYGDVD